jgi:Ca2+-binding EF-hand superfamily protein
VQPSSAAPSPLDAQLLSTLERSFAEHAAEGGRLDQAAVKRALGLRTEYIARRMMQIFDTNDDGVVTKDEFLAAVRALILGTDREKLFFAFRLYDHDGDGFLDRLEIERMISLSLAESSIAERATQTSEQLAQRILASADRDRDGRLSFEELAKHVESRPELLRQMTRSEAIWLAPNEELLLLLDQRAGVGRALV